MATTTKEPEKTLGKSTGSQLRRHQSHESFLRVAPTRRVSLLGLVSPEFEMAPLTPVTPLTSVTRSSPLAPIEKACNRIQRLKLEGQWAMKDPDYDVSDLLSPDQPTLCLLNPVSASSQADQGWALRTSSLAIVSGSVSVR